MSINIYVKINGDLSFIIKYIYTLIPPISGLIEEQGHPNMEKLRYDVHLVYGH